MLSVLTVVLVYTCYILYSDEYSTNKKPTFLSLNIYPILVQENATNQAKEFSNNINKVAMEISNRIINHENALIKHGLLPEFSDDKVEWFKPPIEVNYGDGTCSESDREVYRDIFAKWKNVSATYQIPYFLTDGTLIGAARNGDIVPWDGDADIMVDGRFNEVIAAIADQRGFDRYDGVPRLVFQKDFRKPVPEDKKGTRLYYTEHRRRWDCWGKQVDSQTDNCAFQEPFGRLIKNGHHMDLYDYHYKDDIIHEAAGNRFPVSMVFPLKKCMMLNMEMPCPRQTVEYLKKIYGDGVLPPKYTCNNTKWI